MPTWLSVFEDPDPTPERSGPVGEGWRVTLSSADTLRDIELGVPFRTSPIFPASSDTSIPDITQGTHFIYLLAFDSAFRVLARLLDADSESVSIGLFFSLGLASVVCVSSDPNLMTDIPTLAGQLPRSSEVWRLEDGRITDLQHTVQEAQACAIEQVRLPDYRNLPLVPRITVDEFVASMGLLLPKVAIHMPSELDAFSQLNSEVQDLVREMTHAVAPGASEPPETLSQFSGQRLLSDPEEAHVILHQAADRIDQINTALSYLHTQALSGAIPVLERRSLIRRHSLLGIGTSILALTRIARSIESAFAQGALEQWFKFSADKAAPLKDLDGVNSSARTWEGAPPGWWRGLHEPCPSYLKLPYFSGRMGFRETEYTISASIHALSAGSGPEWSLLTLTHEMVHGHVRSLLSNIFQGDVNELPVKKQQELYSRFEAHMEQQPVARESLLDSVRFVIFTYCCLAVDHGSLTQDVVNYDMTQSSETDLGMYLLSQEDLWRQWAEEKRNINEIIVHVLDFHYFYNSNIQRYLQLIWRSWASLSVVTSNLRQYILRSLLVSSVNGRDIGLKQRFERSITDVSEALDPLTSHDFPGVDTVRTAIHLLNDRDWVARLFYPFVASCLIVDLADNVLKSDDILGAIRSGDSHFDVKDTEVAPEVSLTYTVPEGFADDEILAPAAYLAATAERCLETGDWEPHEGHTARLFLACCSHIREGHLSAR